jgi:hypothetical protein
MCHIACVVAQVETQLKYEVLGASGKRKEDYQSTTVRVVMTAVIIYQFSC